MARMSMKRTEAPRARMSMKRTATPNANASASNKMKTATPKASMSKVATPKAGANSGMKMSATRSAKPKASPSISKPKSKQKVY